MDKIVKIFNFIKIKDFFFILNKSQKRNFLILIFFIFFNAILEMIGVGIIFPFLKLITQENYTFLGINFYYNNEVYISYLIEKEEIPHTDLSISWNFILDGYQRRPTAAGYFIHHVNKEFELSL